MNEFIECPTCAAKTGMPVLCESCLSNRSRILSLQESLRNLIPPENPMKLCYIDGNWAYFTDQPLTGDGRQWGEGWDNTPYEHNAEPPYDYNGEKIYKLAWDGPLNTPGNCCNSSCSVEQINNGVVAWLATEKWHEGPPIVIHAGMSPEEFERLIHAAGGKVYVCSE